MLNPKLDPLPAPVADLQDRITQWRRTRPHREPMPEDLWLKSAQFARQHGLYAIAKALKLNYEALKGHVLEAPKRRARSPSSLRSAFVQLDPMPGIPSGSSSTVEIEGVRGGKLTIRLSSSATLDAVAIVDAFLKGRQ